jgi:hypothetical protein
MPRTTGWTLLHLRVATLIAILVANLTLISIFAPSAQAAQSTKEIYGYSCCGGGFGTINYHPGETIKIDWVRTSLRSSAAPAKTVFLSASASGPFPTIAAAKKAFSGSHPALGHTIFAATTLHVSDEKADSPVSLLHVPPSATTGFYELTIKIVKGKNSSGGGAIFTVKP